MIFRRLTAAVLIAFLAAPPALAQETAGTTVEGLNVARGEAPLPIVGEGAALYSPEQTASFICENQDLGIFRILTGPVMQAAHDATLRARQARIDFFQGTIPEQAMIDAELERQDAVRRIGGTQTDEALGPPERDGLTISDVRYERVLENARPVLLVRGTINNTTDEAKEVPPITMRTFDVRGFFLAGQTSHAEVIEAPAGGKAEFLLRFRNPPHYTTRVSAHFAPPFLVRNFRGCDFFDPIDFDPNESAVRRNVNAQNALPPVPVPEVGDGAPRYSPAELAAMAVRARREAELALGSASDVCAELAGRRNWRDRMILADRIEEAWIATNAADEIRRDAARDIFYPDEVARAELDRQAAVRAFMGARPVVTLESGLYPDLSVEDVRLTISGDTATVRARVVNRGADRARLPAMRILVRDRFGFVVVESIQRPGGRVRAGREENVAFEFTLEEGLAARGEAAIAC